MPAQTAPPSVVDLRGAAFGPRGYKLKNADRFACKRKASEMEVDEEAVEDVGHIPSVRAVKKTKLNVIGAGKVRVCRSICLVGMGSADV